MPYLVRGHLRYTSADYLLQDFEEAARLKARLLRSDFLVEKLADETRRLAMMHKDPNEYATLYSPIYSDTLKEALLLVTALAQREGLSLTDILTLPAERTL
jgi:hypothetical protein